MLAAHVDKATFLRTQGGALWLTLDTARDTELDVCKMLLRSCARGALVSTGLDRRGTLHEQPGVFGGHWGGQGLDDKLPAHVSVEQRFLLQTPATPGL